MKQFEKSIKDIEADYRQICSENGFKHLDFLVESKIAKRLVERSVNDRFPLTQADPNSIGHALFNAAAMGISLSPALDHAMLGGEFMPGTGRIVCKLHLTYKGLLHLCSEAGAISHVTTWVIRAKDRVSMSGDITCKPNVEIEDLFGDRGDVVGALCTICTPNGDYLTTKMSAQELNQIAIMSGNDAWFDVFADEFRKKQVLKRALHTVASAHHGRLATAAKYLSENDLDLYERTERQAMTAQQVHGVRGSSNANNLTRAETAFGFGKNPNVKEKCQPFAQPTPTIPQGGMLLF